MPGELKCKLTSPELQLRKQTILTELKQLVIESKETASGYEYKFNGDDDTLDKLTSFIKTERQCCDFFTFGLTIGSAFTTLHISGHEGAKEFIRTELDL